MKTSITFDVIRRLILILALVVGLGRAGVATAEFLQPNEVVWGDNQVVVVKTFKPAGFFFVHAEKGINPRNFDLATIAADSVRSFFISLDGGRFRSIATQAGDLYGIGGDLTVELAPGYRLAIAAHPTVPFLTFERTAPGREAILGFLGADNVFNLSGKKAVEALTASQALVERYGAEVKPFALVLGGKLHLEGEDVVAKRIGLKTAADNSCASPDASYSDSAANNTFIPLIVTNAIVVAWQPDGKNDRFVTLTAQPDTGCVSTPLFF